MSSDPALDGAIEIVRDRVMRIGPDNYGPGSAFERFLSDHKGNHLEAAITAAIEARDELADGLYYQETLINLLLEVKRRSEIDGSK